jgi:UDP-N-acetylmuramoyl-tripeptide--D-alanyl-D-alanine ligase
LIKLSLHEIFAAAGVTWASDAASADGSARFVDAVSTDTRQLRPGSLFVALPGPRFNGADFASAALEAGASAVLVQESGEGVLAKLAELNERYGVPIAACPDTREALGKIGSMVRRRSTAKALAITGSCGKTTTKAMVAHMLRAGSSRPDEAIVSSPKSFNNYIGLPHTLMLTEDTTEFMVLEVGTNGPGEIAELAAIAEPNVAMITTIGRAHLEGLGSVKGIADEKGALLASLDPSSGDSVAILNADCPMMPRLLARVPEGVPVLTFGCMTSEQRIDAILPSVYAVDVQATPRGTEFKLTVDSELTPGFEVEGRDIVVPLLGVHTAANVVASLASVLALGGDLEAALGSIETLEAEPHRLQPTLAGDVFVIDDSYNANPQSMAAAIRTLTAVDRAAALNGSLRVAAPGQGQERSPARVPAKFANSPAEAQDGGKTDGLRRPERVLVAGAMGEMGERRLALHREVGEIAGASGIDRLFLAGESHDQDALAAMAAGAVAEGMAPENVHLCRTVPGAIDALTASESRLNSGDICLVKASRSAGLERVVEALARHFNEEHSTGVDGRAGRKPRDQHSPGAHS